MTTALVLGATGLLGSNLVRELRKVGIDAVGTARRRLSSSLELSKLNFVEFEIGDSIDRLLDDIKPDLVFNCIATKPNLSKSFMNNSFSLIQANSLFARNLAKSVRRKDSFLFQFSTDAVFHDNGKYHTESSVRFPTNIYGMSKCIGETFCSSSLLIRATFVATKNDILANSNHLSARIRNIEHASTILESARVNWNGITVGSLSRILAQISLQKSRPVGIRHIFSSKPISRHELTQALATHFDRKDLKVESIQGFSRNALLNSDFLGEHENIWSLSGFRWVPTFYELLEISV